MGGGETSYFSLLCIFNYILFLVFFFFIFSFFFSIDPTEVSRQELIIYLSVNQIKGGAEEAVRYRARRVFWRGPLMTRGGGEEHVTKGMDFF